MAISRVSGMSGNLSKKAFHHQFRRGDFKPEIALRGWRQVPFAQQA
jgi:hypothetical protein